ncbi:MAG: hypothetical protein ACFFAE_17760 [Candidatus Hodarchaeota archaeon]
MKRDEKRKIRITYKIDPKLNHDCNLIHIEDYDLKEVILPKDKTMESRKAIAITIRGRNFKAVAQPLRALVGDISIRYLRIAPDEKSIVGILLKEPPKGAYVDVILGNLDHARHPDPFNPSMIKRIG